MTNKLTTNSELIQETINSLKSQIEDLQSLVNDLSSYCTEVCSEDQGCQSSNNKSNSEAVDKNHPHYSEKGTLKNLIHLLNFLNDNADRNGYINRNLLERWWVQCGFDKSVLSKRIQAGTKSDKLEVAYKKRPGSSTTTLVKIKASN